MVIYGISVKRVWLEEVGAVEATTEVGEVTTEVGVPAAPVVDVGLEGWGRTEVFLLLWICKGKGRWCRWWGWCEDELLKAKLDGNITTSELVGVEAIVVLIGFDPLLFKRLSWMSDGLKSGMAVESMDWRALVELAPTGNKEMCYKGLSASLYL